MGTVTLPRPGVTLRVTCWCEARMADIDAADVTAGRTFECGLAECVPPVGFTSVVPLGAQRRTSNGMVPRTSTRRRRANHAG